MVFILRAVLGSLQNLTDFEDCFLSNLWSFLCFFSDSYTLITLIINTSTFYLVCVYACANACMHTLQHICRSQRTAWGNWISPYVSSRYQAQVLRLSGTYPYVLNLLTGHKVVFLNSHNLPFINSIITNFYEASFIFILALCLDL